MGMGRGGKQKTEFIIVALHYGYICPKHMLFCDTKNTVDAFIFCDLSFVTCLQFVKNLKKKFLLNSMTSKTAVVNIPLLLLTLQEFPYPKGTLNVKVSSEQYVCSLSSPVLCLKGPEKSLHPA
jgi:hypothetical protein